MIHRVLLLTDGLANVGVTDPNVLIATARQKAEAGVVTTTLGFGTNFNEDLLIGMAQAAGGNFYFIQTPDEAEEVFRIEAESLASVVAQNLRRSRASASRSQPLQQLPRRDTERCHDPEHGRPLRERR